LEAQARHRYRADGLEPTDRPKLNPILLQTAVQQDNSRERSTDPNGDGVGILGAATGSLY